MSKELKVGDYVSADPASDLQYHTVLKDGDLFVTKILTYPPGAVRLSNNCLYWAKGLCKHSPYDDGLDNWE